MPGQVWNGQDYITFILLYIITLQNWNRLCFETRRRHYSTFALCRYVYRGHVKLLLEKTTNQDRASDAICIIDFTICTVFENIFDIKKGTRKRMQSGVRTRDITTCFEINDYGSISCTVCGNGAHGKWFWVPNSRRSLPSTHIITFALIHQIRERCICRPLQ